MLYRIFLAWIVFSCGAVHLEASDKKEHEWLYTASSMSAGVAVSAGAIYLILKRGYTINVEKTWLNIPLNLCTLFGFLATVVFSGQLLWHEVPRYYSESRLPTGREWFSLGAFGGSVFALYRAFQNNAIRNS